jgi:hypothetical protein
VSWTEPRRTPLGVDVDGQTVALIEHKDAASRIEIDSYGHIALRLSDPALMPLLRLCITGRDDTRAAA